MTGSLQTFPTRCTPEALDYAFHLVDSAVEPWAIVSATVVMAEGDLAISNVEWNDDTVTFWLTGGTAVYQRLVCTMVTDSTPPREYELQATIECNP